MKALWTPIIFAAGIGAGWLIFGGGMRESEEVAGNKSAEPVVRKREARPAKTPHEDKFRTFAKQLPDLYNEDTEAFNKTLDPADRAAAIEAIFAQAGPDGISNEAKLMISKILTIWAQEDFDGAWSWCVRIESDANRKFVAAGLLNDLADHDPDRAFAMHLEMTVEDPEFKSHVPFTILQEATHKDAASFLDLLGKLPFNRDDSRNTVMMGFAEDFDFQQAADGITALRKKHNWGMPAVFPANFLTAWAERDADAAFAWYTKTERNPFDRFDPDGSFGKLLEGIEERGVPGASYAWAAGKLNESDTKRDAVILAITEHYSDRRFTMINSIAQAMPDDASRDRFLSDVMWHAYTKDPVISFGYVISQMSSPEARLDTLRRMRQRQSLQPAKIPDAQLHQWGLTRQQVEQADASGR